MATHRPGRYAPAFILLLLRQQPSYGLEILARLTALVPNHRMDSAIVYRTLKQLEREGHVTSHLDDSHPGPARKMYAVTAQGIEALDGHARDIAQCVENLNVLLDTHSALTLARKDSR
jgi:PadR family transcriptional regulator